MEESHDTGQTAAPTVASITAQIDQLRSDSAPGPGNQFNHTGARAVDKQIGELYKQREKLEGTAGVAFGATKTMVEDADGNIREAPTYGEQRPERTGRDTVQKGIARDEANSAEGVLATAKAAGLDVSNLNPDDMTDAGRDGLRHLTMIETGDIKTLGPLLTRAAQELDMPASTVQFLDQFTSRIAEPGDPLSDAILKTIAEYIHDVRSVA